MSEISIHEMWAQALSAYKQGSIKAAKDIFSVIAQADARLSFNLACLYIEEKNYLAALKYLKNALEMDNSLSVAYFQRAYVRYHQGYYDSAHKNYSKTMILMGDKKQISFKSKGLDIILNAREINANLEVVTKAKQMRSDEKLQIFAIPSGIFFRPVEGWPLDDRKKKSGLLTIETDAQVISPRPVQAMFSPLLNEKVNESPFPLSDNSSRLSTLKASYYTPTSPENIRIKVFWNTKDAMALLSYRYILLEDLIRQIRSRLKINFDPTLTNPKTGQVLSQDAMLWDYLKDQSCSQFQIRISESI